MTKTYLIGVDLGTSSTKSALYTTDGKLVADSTIEVPIYYPKPGIVEQENDDFYITAAETVKNCIQESGVNPGEIAAIAFDSQMAGIGAVDENYNPAIRFDSWLDMRCQPFIEYMDKNYGDFVTRLTGCPPTCDHGPKMLWWKNEQPEAYKRITKFVTPAGYVGGKMVGLKGEEAYMDYTYLHFSGFSDAQNGVWSNELCDGMAFDKEKLPDIVEPWYVVGEVNERAAKDFELAPGTIVAAGCGDTAANAFGGGVVKAGMLFDVAGTASVFAGCTDKFVADVNNRALMTMRSVIPGLWNPLAYIAGGGLAVRWFRDQFFNNYRGEQQDLTDGIYSKMISQFEEIPPGSEGLIFSPHLGGRICPATPEMRGSWIGFSWGHTQAHFGRAVLESVAYEYAYYLSILKELIPDMKMFEARVVGGGARSLLWNQIKADVLGVPYQSLVGNEFGSWGSAMIAGKAAGIFEDLTLVADEFAVLAGKLVQPNPEFHKVYKEKMAQQIKWQAVLSQAFVEFDK